LTTEASENTRNFGEKQNLQEMMETVEIQATSVEIIETIKKKLKQ
jgi:hypothetical protein